MIKKPFRLGIQPVEKGVSNSLGSIDPGFLFPKSVIFIRCAPLEKSLDRSPGGLFCSLVVFGRYHQCDCLARHVSFYWLYCLPGDALPRYGSFFFSDNTGYTILCTRLQKCMEYIYSNTNEAQKIIDENPTRS